MKHKEHICRFNDGDQSCDCYDAGVKKGNAYKGKEHREWYMKGVRGERLRIEGIIKSQIGYIPDGHDENACINHEKYTSACCGCQKQNSRIVLRNDIIFAINEEEIR